MKKITEEQIIDLVSNKNSFREEVIVPIGEDASVLYPKQDKNIVITIMGPSPNTKRTNFAEFFVCPNSLFFLFD